MQEKNLATGLNQLLKVLSENHEPRSLIGVNNIYLDTDLGTLDILSSVEGLPAYEVLRHRATQFQLFGTPV